MHVTIDIDWALAKAHCDHPAWFEQRDEFSECARPIDFRNMHPYRTQQYEIESQPQSKHVLEIRQGIVDPVDRIIGM